MHVFTTEQFNAEVSELEEARAILRTTFTEQQDEIPELRTLNGIEYRALDQQLVDEIEKIQRQWNVRRGNYAQGKDVRTEVVQALSPAVPVTLPPKNPKYKVVWHGGMANLR